MKLTLVKKIESLDRPIKPVMDGRVNFKYHDVASPIHQSTWLIAGSHSYRCLEKNLKYDLKMRVGGYKSYITDTKIGR